MSSGYLTSEQEREVLKPVILAAYVIGGRAEDAFALASELLDKNSENLDVLIRMSQAGINERVKRNPKTSGVGAPVGA